MMILDLKMTAFEYCYVFLYIIILCDIPHCVNRPVQENRHSLYEDHSSGPHELLL